MDKIKPEMRYGWSSMDIESPNSNLVLHLLEKGADPNITTTDDRFPIEFTHSQQVAEYLVEYDSEIPQSLSSKLANYDELFEMRKRSSFIQRSFFILILGPLLMEILINPAIDISIIINDYIFIQKDWEDVLEAAIKVYSNYLPIRMQLTRHAISVPAIQILRQKIIDPINLKLSKKISNRPLNKVYIGQRGESKIVIKKSTERRIFKEALIMAMFNESERIVKLEGISWLGPHYSLVMEYMPGGTLETLLHESKQALTWTVLYQISLDIIQGLEELHKQDIIHGDLSSRNVLLDNAFRAKLADFEHSILTQYGDSRSFHLFASEWREYYDFAPEFRNNSQPVTTATDLYFLAIIFGELITRQDPFDLIESKEPKNIPKDTPKEFEEIIRNCMHEAPEQRPQLANVKQTLFALRKAEREKMSRVNSASASALDC